MQSTSSSYTDCLKTMYGLRRFGIKLGLETIQQILRNLGDPQKTYQCIHVAGTNGKGSIASMLTAILTECGFKTGLYTSPHLVRFNERIRVNGREITDDQVVAAYEAVKGVPMGSREPTFFEFATAMALYEFGRQQVDWAVIETGMGGRLDATNVVQPAVSIISNISIEHREYLGNTITQIAGEKGGIIKPSTPVVTGAAQKSALDVLKEIATSNSAPLFRLGGEFRTRRTSDGTFTYYGIQNVWRALQLNLAGKFQFRNAALALATCEMLLGQNVSLNTDCIKQGLAKTVWPGRLEVIQENPLVIFDGAHNLVAARNLAHYLDSHIANKKITLVTGILDDKPYAAMLKSLLPLCTRVILTQPVIDRALPPESLKSVAENYVGHIEIIPDVGSAVRHAIDTSASDDAVCVAGSLYLVGDAKKAIGL